MIQTMIQSRIQTINRYDFHRAFNELRPGNFSYDALDLLFDFFESIEEGTGEQIELDIITICCEFSEDSVKSIIENNSMDVAKCTDANELKDVTIAYLEENTFYVGETANSLVYQNF